MEEPIIFISRNRITPGAHATVDEAFLRVIDLIRERRSRERRCSAPMCSTTTSYDSFTRLSGCRGHGGTLRARICSLGIGRAVVSAARVRGLWPSRRRTARTASDRGTGSCGGVRSLSDSSSPGGHSCASFGDRRARRSSGDRTGGGARRPPSGRSPRDRTSGGTCPAPLSQLPAMGGRRASWKGPVGGPAGGASLGDAPPSDADPGRSPRRGSRQADRARRRRSGRRPIPRADAGAASDPRSACTDQRRRVRARADWSTIPAR